jgi:hypothetical protein
MLIMLIYWEKKQGLLQASSEAGAEVTTEKTQYMVVSRHQNPGQNHNSLTAIKFFENLSKFK